MKAEEEFQFIWTVAGVQSVIADMLQSVLIQLLLTMD